jgi:glycine/D-amino acid oxidase-like deaminating enzyme
MIGKVAGHPGLIVAGGHEGSGLTLSPATSKLVAAAIFGGEVPEFASEFTPEIVLAKSAN